MREGKRDMERKRGGRRKKTGGGGIGKIEESRSETLKGIDMKEC